MNLKLQVKGLADMRKRMRARGNAASQALDKATVAELGAVMNAAQQTVPVITGRLRSSAFIRKDRSTGRTDISFGYDAPYATNVHENPFSRGYKWVERAWQKVRSGMLGRIGAQVKRALK